MSGKGLSGVEDGSAPSPRLCHLIKWPDFDGYGFNLHAEKAKTGQYIGKVDADSPAQLAGLREGDRIIEVNLVNISNENHRQVVERIKSIPNETKLLVIDETADKWYKENKVIVKSTQSNVVHYKTPVPRPLNDNNNAVDDNNDRNDTQPNHLNPAADVSAVEVVDVANGLQNGDNDSHSTVESIPMKADIEVIDIKTNGSVNAVNGNDRKDSLVLENGGNSSGASTPKSVSRSQLSTEAVQTGGRPSSSGSNTNVSIPDSPTSSKSGSSFSAPSRQLSDSSGVDLNLNMSASEMRQILAQRKKLDAKKAQMDLKQKYEIIQQM